MKTPHKNWRAVLTLLTLAITLISTPARAQFVVSDPTNLVQNTVSAAAEVEATIQQLRAVIIQTRQLKNQIQNLKKLDIQDLNSLRDALDEVHSVVGQTMQVASSWGVLAIDFAETYGICGQPPDLSLGEWDLSARWECGTDVAIEANLKLQADVAQVHGKLFAQVKTLQAKSRAVDGVVAATELNTQVAAISVNQQALQLELSLRAERANQLERLEYRRKRALVRSRHRARITRGFGDHEPQVPAVTLRAF